MFLYTFVDTRHGIIELARELNERSSQQTSRTELDL
jgi:hypothetical protein